MAPKVKKVAKSAGTKKSPTTKETGKSGSPRTALGRLRKIDKSKIKGKRTKHKLKLKGWLATPADWARFNAWVKKNAQPKKIPEPEPIVSVRPSKPLSQLKKRINILSKPKKAPDLSIICEFDFTVPRAALKAIPSKRTILLALPNIRLVDYGRVYYKISPAALTYEASQRIIELSQPRVIIPEECKPPRLSICDKRVLDEERLRKLALAKKLLDCPQQLTKEEIEELFTPQGIRRTALTYKITAWVSFLALPAYKRIKDRKDEKAKTWKKMIIEEGERRASSRMEELSKPRIRKIITIRANPFIVRKGALSASASGRIESLAKPSRPRSPVERRAPREKDKYGRPIFEMPVYGKVLPKTKPYKMGECPEPKKKMIAKKRPIDSIVYEPTFDPCIYPDLAKRQKMERKRAEKLSKTKKSKRKKQKKRLKKSNYYETKKLEDKKEEEEKEEKVEKEKEETDVVIDDDEAQ
ncbi:hypothetical protein WN48_06137 [Eufriesea mexicana]|uniref:Uncharacterized protein n=1 Tax=Eufriesea mexicana TaxID=516756 RepID=A0A310SU05_9HYME|nr:hypothetical protein WN48_06137 [Eufriesea mexicana]